MGALDVRKILRQASNPFREVFRLSIALQQWAEDL